jgi:hypothetical protein
MNVHRYRARTSLHREPSAVVSYRIDVHRHPDRARRLLRHEVSRRRDRLEPEPHVRGYAEWAFAVIVIRGTLVSNLVRGIRWARAVDAEHNVHRGGLWCET